MQRRIARKHILVTAAALAIPARAGAAESFTLKIGLAQAAATAQGEAAARLSRAVSRRTRGQLRIDIYPSMQLASQGATLDALGTGVMDLAMNTSTILQPVLPQFQVFDMPFLFRDLNAAFKVLNGPIGNEFLIAMDRRGILGLGWGTSGFRQISTTTRAVTVPEDMKGLRIRIQAGAVYVATYQALGAVPIVIDASETLMSLTQRAVDAIDLNLDAIALENYVNVIKHVAMTNHIISLLPMMGSKRRIEALPPALQTVLKEECRAAMLPYRASVERQVAKDITILKAAGIGVTEVQHAAFRKAVDPVYAMVQARIGADLLDRVSRAANAA